MKSDKTNDMKSDMIKLVVTGSIGMGKSATAQMIAQQGWPLYDADAEVHRLYMAGGAAIDPIAQIFPSVIRDGAVDRKELSKIILGDEEKVKKIEAIVHPLTRAAQKVFLKRAEKNKAEGVVFDIPLFFETGGNSSAGNSSGGIDYVIVASAPENVQKERALLRPDMTEKKFFSILARQMPDEEKRRRADFIVETQYGMDHAQQQISQILQKIKQEKS